MIQLARRSVTSRRYVCANIRVIYGNAQTHQSEAAGLIISARRGGRRVFTVALLYHACPN